MQIDPGAADKFFAGYGEPEPKLEPAEQTIIQTLDMLRRLDELQ